jgi:hypothetical protein
MRLILFISFAVLMSGCATMNDYKKVGTGGTLGGYDEVEIKPGVYKVTFQGQGDGTNDVNVYSSFLRRSADLARQNKAPYFKVTEGLAGSIHRGMGFASVSIPNYTGLVTFLQTKEPDSFSADEILAKYPPAKK